MSFIDLPRIVDIENVKVIVIFLANVFFFTEKCQLELFDKITRTEQFCDGLLFFTQGACFSIIQCKTGSQWNRQDIDYGLEKGDALYKLIHTDQLLSCTCLQKLVQVEHLELSRRQL